MKGGTGKFELENISKRRRVSAGEGFRGQKHTYQHEPKAAEEEQSAYVHYFVNVDYST